MAFGSCKETRKASPGLHQKNSLADMFHKPLGHISRCKLAHGVSGGFSCFLPPSAKPEHLACLYVTGHPQRAPH